MIFAIKELNHNPRVNGINKAHLELYKYMKNCHDKRQQFTKEDLFEIYQRFVVSRQISKAFKEVTDEQLYNNASAWLNRAIAMLVRKGFLGLTFRTNLKIIEAKYKKCLN